MTSTTVKDQTQRLYDAEDFLKAEDAEMSLEECRRYIRDVLVSDYVFTSFTFAEEIIILDGRGRIAARAGFDDDERPVIHLPKWARTKYTILHEIAHHLVHDACDDFSHGPAFARTLLDLVYAELGILRFLRLRIQFMWFRVKVARTRP